MKKIQGSVTEKNLLVAFAGEGQARNRYTYWASKAKKEGYEQIAGIFELTANQEKEHAERFFKFLQGGEINVSGLFPAGVIDTTQANLRQAIAGEHYEGNELYPQFARIAKDEGFKEIAEVFEHICIAENAHEKRYQDFLTLLEKKLIFHRDKPVVWQCRNCGYVMTGTEPPEKCPSCAHDRAYFEVQVRSWMGK